MLAYDPATGTMTTQTIVRVYLNHDHDRLDVTLALPAAHASASAPTASQATHDAETAREQARAVAGHGLRAPPNMSTAATSAQATTPTGTTTTSATTEVIHTTSNHPWLTADQGWQVAGDLRVGEQVRLLDGGTATVVALHTLPGVGPMWDLSLDSVHTFAVGAAQAVVHNCPPTDDGVVGDGAQAGGTAPKPFAMGLGEHLDDFAAQYGADTYKDLPDNTNWRPGVLQKLSDPNQRVLFNLDGVDVWRGVSRAASGRGGATDWELFQIYQEQRYGSGFPNFEFWQNGVPVENPFK